jgi:hypothetical protein
MKRSYQRWFAALIGLLLALGVWHRHRSGVQQAQAKAGAGSTPVAAEHPVDSSSVFGKRSHPLREQPRPLPATVDAVASRDGGVLKANQTPQARAWAACRSDGKCPKGTMCFPIDDHTIGCFGSNCRDLAHSTEDCGANRACIAVDNVNNVHRCEAAGNADVGQECDLLRPAAKDRMCRPGLDCIGGRCRAACGAGCPIGQQCIQVTSTDRQCVGDLCKRDADCSTGQVCMDANHEPVSEVPLRTCVTVGHFDDGTASCTPTSCNSDQVCDMNRRGATLLGRCRKPCIELDSSTCEPGYSCGRSPRNPTSFCYQSCDPQNPITCPSGEECGTVDDQFSKWACTPSDGTDGLAASTDQTYTHPVKRIGF